MKNLFRLTALALFFCLPAFLVTGCNKPEDDVKAAFEKFTQAIVAGDFSEAKKHVTKDTISSLTFFETIMNAADAERKEMFRAKMKETLGSVQTISITITGDNAELKAFAVVEGEREEETVNLRREDGQWKIAFPQKQNTSR